MAVQLDLNLLSPAQLAQIPSASLPLAPQLLHLLSSLHALSLSIFTAASSLNPPDQSQSYAQLLALDGQLRELLVLVEASGARQARIEALIEALSATESTFQSTLHTLNSAKTSLDPIVKSGSLDRTAIESARRAELDPSVVLSYARLLAPFTSAPPQSIFTEEDRKKGMDPSGRSLPEGALPPFPTEGVMRRGRLQFGALGGEEGEAMGEVGEVGGKHASICLEWHSKGTWRRELGADGMCDRRRRCSAWRGGRCEGPRGRGPQGGPHGPGQARAAGQPAGCKAPGDGGVHVRPRPQSGPLGAQSTVRAECSAVRACEPRGVLLGVDLGWAGRACEHRNQARACEPYELASAQLSASLRASRGAERGALRRVE